MVYKLVEKIWMWYACHVKSHSQNMLNGVSRRQSPFAYRKSAKYDPKMSRRTYSNFWTNRDTEDCNHSKWPELPQGFKFLIKNCFCLTWAECCPIYCCPRPYSVGPGALSPTQILSPSFGTWVFYQKPMFLRVGQVIWWHSARANVQGEAFPLVEKPPLVYIFYHVNN